MHVSELHLINVRQFSDVRFKFQSGFNLLVGENGKGKTTILRAIIATTGLRKYIGNRKLGFETSDILLERDYLEVITTLKSSGRSLVNTYNLRPGNYYERSGDRTKIVLIYFASNEALSSNMKGKRARSPVTSDLKSSPDKEEFLFQAQRGQELSIKQEDRFGRSTDINRFIRSALAKITPDFIDFGWQFEAYSCSVHWPNSTITNSHKSISKKLSDLILRSLQDHPIILRDLDNRSITINSEGLVIDKEQEGHVTTGFDKLLAFTPDGDSSKDLQLARESYAVVRITPRIFVQTTSGKLGLSQLSDGQQRLFSIFVDIARILSISSKKKIKDSVATVLIDEIDVHLHPKWQRIIAPSLEDLFPKCQFIATTHSPFVIQSVKEHQLYSLDQSALSLSANNGIEEIAVKIMGVSDPDVSPRYIAMLDIAREYFSILETAKSTADKKKVKELRSKLRNLSRRYAENPAYQAYLELHGNMELGPEEII